MSFPIVRLFFCCVLLMAIHGCTKKNQDPGNTVVVPDNPNGVLYVEIPLHFVKLDVSTDSVYWTSQVINAFGSAGNPIRFDSNYFYHGNNSGITCYSSSTGQFVWMTNWLAFNDAINYREPAFNDSLIFFTSPTSEWDHGYLYCKNKRTGASVWEKQYDFGYVDTSVNGIPVLAGNSVIIKTRDQNNQRHLTAYAVQSGNQQWSVPVSISLSDKMWAINGRIYAAYGPQAVCFDALSGQQLWSTDMNIPKAYLTYNFIDGNKLIVVKVLDNTSYKVLQIQLSDGTIVKSSDLTIPTTYALDPGFIGPMSCSYKNSRLFFASFYASDSLDILAYDITNMAQLWRSRFTNSVFSGVALVTTDKYLIFPINEQYDNPNNSQSSFIFLDYSGKLVKKLPYNSIYIDDFVYKENGVVYQQPSSF